MLEVDGVGDAEGPRGDELRGLFVVACHDRLAQEQEAPGGALLLVNARVVDELHEGRARSVEDRDLGPFHLDVRVVDARPTQRGEYVFHSTDAHVGAAERRIEPGVHHVFCEGGNLHAVAAENDSGIRRRRGEGQADLRSRVETDTVDRGALPEGTLAEGMEIHHLVSALEGAAATENLGIFT